MDFEYKGGNCVVITSKQGALVIDGNIANLGAKSAVDDNAVEVATQPEFATGHGRITIDMPGEYEVNNISVVGIPAGRLIDFDGSQAATMYRIVFSDLTVAVLGHVATPLSDEQLESIGMVDVLIVPIGGGGYTLDAHHAVEMVHKIDPKVIIPTHYADSHLSYEVPQEELEPFIKELGAASETVAKWKVKGGVVPETQTVIVITRSS